MRVVEKNKEVDLNSLKNSPLTFEVGKYKFFFSAIESFNKFKAHYQEEIELFNARFNRNYHNAYKLTFTDLALVRYYYIIEKHGFYLEIDGVGIDCLDKIQFQSEVRIVS